MAPVTVFGTANFANAARVMACLEEVGVEYEVVEVDYMAKEHKGAEHLARNPLGQIPAFQDGDVKLFGMCYADTDPVQWLLPLQDKQCPHLDPPFVNQRSPPTLSCDLSSDPPPTLSFLPSGFPSPLHHHRAPNPSPTPPPPAMGSQPPASRAALEPLPTLDPAALAGLPVSSPLTVRSAALYGHLLYLGTLTRSATYISSMPESPLRKPAGHRRALSEIIGLPDDLDVGAPGGGDAPVLSDENEEELFSMFLDVDKLNSRCGASESESSCALAAQGKKKASTPSAQPLARNSESAPTTGTGSSSGDVAASYLSLGAQRRRGRGSSSPPDLLLPMHARPPSAAQHRAVP